MCHSPWYKWTVLEATSPLIFTPIQSATVTLLITLYNMIVETQGLILWNIHQRASERYKTCSICASLFPGVRLYFLVCFLTRCHLISRNQFSAFHHFEKRRLCSFTPLYIFNDKQGSGIVFYVSYTHSRTLCELHTL